jgi:hypothetical protein
MPCPYANVLGTPGQGVHATRIFGLAFADIFLTILLSITTAWATKTSFVGNLLFWFIAGEVLHYVAGTQTAFLTMAGIQVNCK